MLSKNSEQQYLHSMRTYRQWKFHGTSEGRPKIDLVCQWDVLLFHTSQKMYLSSVRSMLPFFFVTNRNNYARWTPIYLLDMLNLPSEVESRFNAGFFVSSMPICFHREVRRPR
jgi:hypothetical protein